MRQYPWRSWTMRLNSWIQIRQYTSDSLIMCTQHTCIMWLSCEYIENASCIQEQWFVLLNSLIRNFLTFLMFLLNSLCLTGRVWNKFCKETVVPVYMGEKEHTHVEMLCYGSCIATRPLTSLAQLVLVLICPSLSYSKRVPTLAELWHVVTLRSLQVWAKLRVNIWTNYISIHTLCLCIL